MSPEALTPVMGIWGEIRGNKVTRTQSCKVIILQLKLKMKKNNPLLKVLMATFKKNKKKKRKQPEWSGTWAALAGQKNGFKYPIKIFTVK